jgi:hypothetical protein
MRDPVPLTVANRESLIVTRARSVGDGGLRVTWGRFLRQRAGGP